MSGRKTKKVVKSPKKSPRGEGNVDTVASVYSKAVLKRLGYRAGIHRIATTEKEGKTSEVVKLLHEFIHNTQEDMFRTLAVVLNSYDQKTITLSHVVKAANILGTNIDVTNVSKEKKAKGKKSTSEKRKATGALAAAEVKRLQKSSGLLVSHSPFSRLARSRLNHYADINVKMNPAAVRILQMYFERKIVDLLVVAAIMIVRDGNKPKKTLDAKHLDTAHIVYNLLINGVRPASVHVWHDAK